MATESLTQKFVREIEILILTDKWKTGEKIPPLRDLAERFGVSRSVVNAAVAELDEKGFLECYPRQRTVVSNWRRSGTLAVVNAIIENDIDYGNALQSIFECRRLIETEAAELAAQKRKSEDIEAIGNIIAEETNADGKDMVELDMRFHRAVLFAADNMVYITVLNAFGKVYKKLVEKFYSCKPSVTDFVKSKHAELFSAIKAGKRSLAGKIMKELLAHGEKYVLQD